MSFLDAARHRLRTWFGRERLAREMEDEIRFHLELEAAEHERDLAPPDAVLAARHRVGSPLSIGDRRREESGLAFLDRFTQDVSYAIHQLKRAPAFAIGVVVTLALGIGANSTMFAIIDRVMLRAPDGIADAERVVEIRSWRAGRGGKPDTSSVMSFPSYNEFRGMTDVFDAVTAVRGPIDVAVDRGPDASMARGSVIAGDYFGTLGVRPALGRFFDADERGETPAQVAVISDGYWRRHFGAATNIVGRSILIAKDHYTIIGVAPRGFTGQNLGATDVWIPIAAAPSHRFGGTDWMTLRGAQWLTIIARRRSHVPSDRALARARVGWTAWNVQPDRKIARGPTPFFVSLIPAESHTKPEYRVARLLAIVSSLLLLVACANVANLLLSRAVTRRREIAIRLALGMSRGRMIALMLTDTLVLAVLGGAASLALTHWSLPIVRATLFAGTPTGDWGLDWRIVGFTAAAVALATSLAGVVPALQASRTSVLDGLRSGAGVGIFHQPRVRTLLIVIQGALSMLLLTGTGLFVKSLNRIAAQHLGLDLDRVLVADFAMYQSGFTSAEATEVYRDMRTRALQMPGVQSASLTVGVPFKGQYALPLQIVGRDSLASNLRGPSPFIYAVTPDFFATMGTRILSGRGLLPTDDGNSQSVAVVSLEMARRSWPGESALGKCLKIVLRSSTPDCTLVVGVAEDARRAGLIEAQNAQQYYVPLAQAPKPLAEPVLLVRATRPSDIASSLQRTLQSTRPTLPFVSLQSLEDLVAIELRPWHLGASVFGIFGALALLVASVGMYSVTQFGVSQRLHELGVRLALGASGPEIVRMVTREAVRVAALACVAGVLLVALAGRFIQALLFQTSARDPGVMGTIAAVVLASALVAAIVPAARAARVDPVRALKID